MCNLKPIVMSAMTPSQDVEVPVKYLAPPNNAKQVHVSTNQWATKKKTFKNHSTKMLALPMTYPHFKSKVSAQRRKKSHVKCRFKISV